MDAYIPREMTHIIYLSMYHSINQYKQYQCYCRDTCW